MRRSVILLSMALLFAFSATAFAAPAHQLKGGWYWGGHAEVGIMANQYGQGNEYWNGDLAGESGNTFFLNNAWQSDLQFNQAYLYGGKALKDSGFSVGGRLALMWGTDAKYLQSVGLERKDAWDSKWRDGDYYTALPEMYLELGSTKNNLRIGKFLTNMGPESVLSDERFFYTLSPAFTLTPVTQSGITYNWNGGRKFSAFGGWTSGSVSTTAGSSILSAGDYNPDSFFNNSDNNALLAGLSWKPTERLALRYSLQRGQEKNFRDYSNNPTRSYFAHGLVLDYKMGDKWDYTASWVLKNEDDGYPGATWAWGGWYINQQVTYKLSSKWAVGARLGFGDMYANASWPDSDGLFSMSLGANWTPVKNIVVRPELRYDSRSNTSPFNLTHSNWSNAKDSQFSFGVSAYIKI